MHPSQDDAPAFVTLAELRATYAAQCHQPTISFAAVTEFAMKGPQGRVGASATLGIVDRCATSHACHPMAGPHAAVMELAVQRVRASAHRTL